MLSDEQLLANAVRCVKANRGGQDALRFGAVMDTLAVGSTVAKELCIRFGFDPYARLCDQKWPDA